MLIIIFPPYPLRLPATAAEIPCPIRWPRHCHHFHDYTFETLDKPLLFGHSFAQYLYWYIGAVIFFFLVGHHWCFSAWYARAFTPMSLTQLYSPSRFYDTVPIFLCPHHLASIFCTNHPTSLSYLFCCCLNLPVTLSPYSRMSLSDVTIVFRVWCWHPHKSASLPPFAVHYSISTKHFHPPPSSP